MFCCYGNLMKAMVMPRSDGDVLCCRPLEAMNSLSNRWSYGFAFGASSRVVFLLFSKQHILFPAPPWAECKTRPLSVSILEDTHAFPLSFWKTHPSPFSHSGRKIR